MTKSTRTRALSLSATALAAALLLTGCMNQGMMNDGDDDSPAQTTASFNDPDIAFTMEMIPHHEGAVEMADVLLAKDGIDDRVVQLAEQIKAAQSPEIELMQSWLDDWGMGGDMGGMDHGDMSGSGMMSDDDMAALESATGIDASRLFLEQMIVHHQGAIDMASTELADGENADVKALCTSIIASQTAEIATMKQLLTEL
jgi:uncharacterized protein (DUF305 family)